MFDSYVAEVIKLARRPATWVVAIVWLALLLLFTEVFPYVAYRSATDPRAAARLLAPLLPDQLPSHAISGYPLWGGALILVLGALSWGSEYGWGTLKTMLSQRPGRLAFYGDQLLALASAIAVLVVVAFALCILSSLLIATSAGAARDLPAATSFLPAMAAGWLILFTWCLFGACLAILVRGTALSIGLGLVWILAVENLVRFMSSLISGLATVDRFLPGADAGSLVAALGAPASTSTGVAAAVDGTRAMVSLLVYALVFTAGGAIALARRDVQ